MSTQTWAQKIVATSKYDFRVILIERSSISNEKKNDSKAKLMFTFLTIFFSASR